jgi:hypothetical protein
VLASTSGRGAVQMIQKRLPFLTETLKTTELKKSPPVLANVVRH